MKERQDQQRVQQGHQQQDHQQGHALALSGEPRKQLQAVMAEQERQLIKTLTTERKRAPAKKPEAVSNV